MKKHMKITAIGFMAGLMMTYGVFAEGVSVFINGTNIPFDVQPRIIEGRTMVPMRVIFEKLGFEVQWDGATQTVKGYNKERKITVTMSVGNKAVISEDVQYGKKELVADVAPQIIDGRTLVPLRIIAEATGYKVDWNGEKQQVDICSTCWSSSQEMKPEVSVKREVALSPEKAFELLKKYYSTDDWSKVEYRGIEEGGYAYSVSQEDYEKDPTGELYVTMVNPYTGYEYDSVGGMALVNLLDTKAVSMESDEGLQLLKKSSVGDLKAGETLEFYENEMGDAVYMKKDAQGKVVSKFRVDVFTGNVYDYETYKLLTKLEK